MARKRTYAAYALDLAELGTWDWDPKTGGLDWNRHHEKLFGYPEGKFPGTFAAFIDRVHPDDRDGVKDTLNRAAPDQRWTYDYRVVVPDGGLRWIQATGRCQFDEHGKVTRVSGMASDITSLKSATVEIEQRDRLIRSIFNQAVVGIGHSDANGRITAVNPEFCRMLGYTESEIIGRDPIEFTHPDDVVDDEVIRARFDAGELQRHQRIKRYVRKDGTTNWAKSAHTS